MKIIELPHFFYGGGGVEFYPTHLHEEITATNQIPPQPTVVFVLLLAESMLCECKTRETRCLLPLYLHDFLICFQMKESCRVVGDN